MSDSSGSEARRRGEPQEPLPSRERILWAAAREFAEYGLAGARVDRIAEQAECNKQLIYRHFGDKDGLYHAVLVGVLERKMTPGELLELPFGEVLGFHFRWFSEQKLLRRLLLWEALAFDGQVVAEEQRAEHLRADLCTFRERFLRDNQDVDPEEAKMLIVASFAMAIFPSAFPQMVKLLTGKSPADPEFRARYTSFLSGFGIEPFLKALRCHRTKAESAEAEAFFQAVASRVPPPIPSGRELDARAVPKPAPPPKRAVKTVKRKSRP